MCIDCWEAYALPPRVNERIVQAVALIDRVYEGWAPATADWFDDYPGHATGGNLHVQLDDWNLDDFHGPFQVFVSMAPHQLAVQRACYAHLQQMSVEERAIALAWYDGFITEQMPGAPTQRAR